MIKNHGRGAMQNLRHHMQPKAALQLGNSDGEESQPVAIFGASFGAIRFAVPLLRDD
jgi:hypothetical protein